MAYCGAAWLLMLAGVGALQSQCNEVAATLSSPFISCPTTYRYQLWLVVFDGVILIGVLPPLQHG